MSYCRRGVRKTDLVIELAGLCSTHTHTKTLQAIARVTMKAMVNDPGIICFQHCRSKIFAIDVLPKCPECDADLSDNDNAFHMIPFRLPYPFVIPHQHPCSIVLRPTNGDFLNDYFNAMNLHIAITTSTGTIVEFDQDGWMETRKDCSRQAQLWGQSLVVDSVPIAWHEHWDTVLHNMRSTAEQKWTAQLYDEDRYNCYTFVLEFLQRVQYGSLSTAAQNRSTFCEQYIIPRTTAAGKYISLYRKIRDYGFYVNASNPTQNN